VIAHDVIEHALRRIARLVGSCRLGHIRRGGGRRATASRQECGLNRATTPLTVQSLHLLLRLWMATVDPLSHSVRHGLW
jgi:hypothetical protein